MKKLNIINLKFPKGVEHAPMAENDVELLEINVTSNKEGGKPE